MTGAEQFKAWRGPDVPAGEFGPRGAPVRVRLCLPPSQHLFCSVCGVTPYYFPRSNPDGWAVTVTCVAPASIATVTRVDFDGTQWEASYGATGIAAYSK